jgi:hypothetical protein
VSGGVGGTPATPGSVERVAEAIWRADHAKTADYLLPATFSDATAWDKDRYRALARAALGAVTEQPTAPDEQLADALLAADEVLTILHLRGTKGIEQESSAGRIADVPLQVRLVGPWEAL